MTASHGSASRSRHAPVGASLTAVLCSPMSRRARSMSSAPSSMSNSPGSPAPGAALPPKPPS
eukprot:2050976-Lingulodinium_polyedra.AAC.1